MHADSQALAFSPDGTLRAAVEGENGGPRQPLRIWDVRTRSLTAFRARIWAGLIAFSPDGRLLATAADEIGTEVRAVATGRLVKRIGIGDFSGNGDFSRSVTFSPDGRLLFVGQYDGRRGQLYSTRTWKPVGRVFEGHTARITFAQFSPDGRTLVTSGAEGQVILLDTATHKPIGSPLALAPDAYPSVVLSPDGAHVFAVSTTGPGTSFDTSPRAWERHACLVAGHDLSAREWADVLPGRPFQAACPKRTAGVIGVDGPDGSWRSAGRSAADDVLAAGPVFVAGQQRPAPCEAVRDAGATAAERWNSGSDRRPRLAARVLGTDGMIVAAPGGRIAAARVTKTVRRETLHAGLLEPREHTLRRGSGWQT
jgi:hypothetical protein